MIPATLMILLIKSPFDGLIYSQMFLAVQLPITIFTQIYLTSSKKVMGKYANSKRLKIILFMIELIVTFLNMSVCDWILNIKNEIIKIKKKGASYGN